MSICSDCRIATLEATAATQRMMERDAGQLASPYSRTHTLIWNSEATYYSSCNAIRGSTLST